MKAANIVNIICSDRIAFAVNAMSCLVKFYIIGREYFVTDTIFIFINYWQTCNCKFWVILGKAFLLYIDKTTCIEFDHKQTTKQRPKWENFRISLGIDFNGASRMLQLTSCQFLISCSAATKSLTSDLTSVDQFCLLQTHHEKLEICASIIRWCNPIEKMTT